MPLTASLAETVPTERLQGSTPVDTTNRSQFLLLQTLVVIVLCYQLLYSLHTLLSFNTQLFVALGLLLLVLALMLFPDHVWETNWFVGTLVLGDTAMTSFIIYLSGDAGSDLYLTYFLILFLASSTQTLKQHIVLSVILSAGYGLVLYFGASETYVGLEGKLLRIPVLLIMATFYGASAEMVRKERRQKADLIDHITALKQAEEERERLIRQLQDALAKIKTLCGLLPICSLCKKIRDDKGYWNQIESYLRQHSSADFSHGICPECTTKLFPNYESASPMPTDEIPPA